MHLPDLIPVGISTSKSLVVTPELTVAHHVPTLPPVYATPNMIWFMEVVATELVAPLLPEGWVSVGAAVNVKHLAATPVGFTITVTAKVAEVTKSLITFELEAHDGVELAGKGTHTRAPIELKRFLTGVERKAQSFGG